MDRLFLSDGYSPLRKGKWTAEEEKYANKIIEAFSDGTLNIPENSSSYTLRAYLAEKLQCDPMRITKKYAGVSSLGKRVFHGTSTSHSAETIEKTRKELEILEQKFREKIMSSNEEHRQLESILMQEYRPTDGKPFLGMWPPHLASLSGMYPPGMFYMDPSASITADRRDPALAGPLPGLPPMPLFGGYLGGGLSAGYGPSSAPFNGLPGMNVVGSSDGGIGIDSNRTGMDSTKVIGTSSKGDKDSSNGGLGAGIGGGKSLVPPEFRLPPGADDVERLMAAYQSLHGGQLHYSAAAYPGFGPDSWLPFPMPPDADRMLGPPPPGYLSPYSQHSLYGGLKPPVYPSSALPLSYPMMMPPTSVFAMHNDSASPKETMMSGAASSADLTRMPYAQYYHLMQMMQYEEAMRLLHNNSVGLKNSNISSAHAGLAPSEGPSSTKTIPSSVGESNRLDRIAFSDSEGAAKKRRLENYIEDSVPELIDKKLTASVGSSNHSSPTADTLPRKVSGQQTSIRKRETSQSPSTKITAVGDSKTPAVPGESDVASSR